MPKDLYETGDRTESNEPTMATKGKNINWLVDVNDSAMLNLTHSSKYSEREEADTFVPHFLTKATRSLPRCQTRCQGVVYDTTDD